MSLPELPQTTDRRELRKALVRLRLEMRRQEIRHESGQLLKPLTRLRGVGDSCKAGCRAAWASSTHPSGVSAPWCCWAF